MDHYRLLHVEDEKLDRALVRRLIRDHALPFDLSEVPTLREAREVLRSGTVDAILLDHQLRDGTGLELIEPAGDTPVVVLTGYGSEALAVEALKRGARDYLTKDELSGESLRLAILGAIERSRLESELSDAHAQALRAAEVKSRFVAQVSHELRTPLAALLGHAESLDRTGLDETALATVDRIIRGGEHLLELVGDLLDLSRVEAGKLEVDRIEFDPVELVSDVIGFLRARAAEVGSELAVEFVTPIPARLVSDPRRIKQILINLLSNAIKFGDGRTILTLIHYCGEDASGPELGISVIDSGIGLSPEDLTRVFDPYVQAENGSWRRHAGTGLGLPICREIARLLGGDVFAWSRPGVGSAFRASLRVQAIGAPSIQPKSGEVPRVEDRFESLAGIRILLAEDTEILRTVASRQLSESGLSVDAVDNGEDAVTRALASDPYDLVLLDLVMPGVDGIEAARRIRDGGYQGPIVAFSADADPQSTVALATAGFDDFITKPIRRSEMLSVIARHVGPRTL